MCLLALYCPSYGDWTAAGGQKVGRDLEGEGNGKRAQAHLPLHIHLQLKGGALLSRRWKVRVNKP